MIAPGVLVRQKLGSVSTKTVVYHAAVIADANRLADTVRQAVKQ